MSIFSRLKTSIGAKINKLLDSIEDPREVLDYSYEKQQELLTNVKKSIATLVTAKKQLEHQRKNLSESIERWLLW